MQASLHGTVNWWKGDYYEKDLSAQEETEKQSSRLQKENGDDRRQKGFKEKKKQGQKEAVGVIWTI